MQATKKYIIQFLVFGILGIPLHDSAQCTSWRFKNRLQLGTEWDDNIRESRYNAIGSHSFKAMFHTKGSRKTNNWQMMFHFMGGYQAYPKYAEENKLLNEVEGNLGYRFSESISMGANGYAKLKFYVNKPWDYAIGTGQLWLMIHFPYGISTRLFLGIHGLDYASYNFYDFEGLESRVELTKNFTRSLSMRIQFCFDKVQFERDAFDFQLEPFQPVLLEKRQTDRLTTASGGLQYCRSFLLTMSYSFQKNLSNSYGFSYQRHRVQFLYSQTLFWSILLRCSGTYQKKDYRDPLSPFIAIELDTEREESSFLVFDLSKNISSNSALILRFATYRNESPLRAFYYQKKLAMLGFEYRF